MLVTLFEVEGFILLVVVVVVVVRESASGDTIVTWLKDVSIDLLKLGGSTGELPGEDTIPDTGKLDCDGDKEGDEDGNAIGRLGDTGDSGDIIFNDNDFLGDVVGKEGDGIGRLGDTGDSGDIIFNDNNFLDDVVGKEGDGGCSIGGILKLLLSVKV